MMTQRSYLPAAGRDWALPFYDPFVVLLGMGETRRALLEQAALRPGHRVLDIGCGTGTLALHITRVHPDVQVVGLDPDPRALARATRKATRAGAAIRFDRGFADDLPYPDASFDRVFSSFMFHHLPKGDQEKALREVRRVLTPGGSLHLVDFRGHDTHVHGSFLRWLHASQHVKDSAEDRLLTLMRDAGFSDAARVRVGAVFFGHMRFAYHRASVPAA